jgi:hypothetical protein
MAVEFAGSDRTVFLVRWLSIVMGLRSDRYWKSFFLQAVVVEDPINASFADFKATLTQLLGNDLRRRIGIKESVSDGLTDDLFGATIVGLGASSLAQEPKGAFVDKGLTKLEVALPTEAVFLRSVLRSRANAFAVDEHGELPGNVIVGRDGQSALRSGKPMLDYIEIHHGMLSPADVATFDVRFTTKKEYHGRRSESSKIWHNK